MNLSQFLLCLLVATIMTGLITQAIKMILEEWGKTYRANTLAGIVAIFTGAAIGAIYVVIFGVQLDERMWICLIALAFLSWLCAMVGYDKVMQAIEQFRNYGAGAAIQVNGIEQGSLSEGEGNADDESNGGDNEDELPGVQGKPDPQPDPAPSPAPESEAEPDPEPEPDPKPDNEQEAKPEPSPEDENEQNQES